MRVRLPRRFAATLILGVAACGDPAAAPLALDDHSEEMAAALRAPLMSSASVELPAGMELAPAFDPAATIEQSIGMLNEQLAAQGSPIALERVEWVTASGTHEAGQTVFANDRTLRLESRWVAGDARRDATGNQLTHLFFGGLAAANGAIDSRPAIFRSFDTWNAVHCSKLRVTNVADQGVWPSAILTLGGVSGNPFLADISTIGFLPGFIFDLVLGPGASNVVLAVTFTFHFINPATGEPTDVNRDNRTDTALKEVWYNDAFLWTTTGGPGVDIETVALHENGHALELGHFGRIAINNRTGALQVSPRAAMNAVVLGTQRTPLPTDQAAYCSNFASWPR